MDQEGETRTWRKLAATSKRVRGRFNPRLIMWNCMQLYVGGQKPRKSEILGPNMPRSFRVMGHVTGHVQNFLITSSAQKELPASELCHHHSCQLYILTQEPCTRLQGKSAREKSYVAQHKEQIEGFSRGSNLYGWAGWAKIGADRQLNNSNVHRIHTGMCAKEISARWLSAMFFLHPNSLCSYQLMFCVMTN